MFPDSVRLLILGREDGLALPVFNWREGERKKDALADQGPKKEDPRKPKRKRVIGGRGGC